MPQAAPPLAVRTEDQLGVNAGSLITPFTFGSSFSQERQLAAIDAAGIRVVRGGVVWDAVQRCAECNFSWDMYDPWFAALSRHRIHLHAILGFSARWASSRGDDQMAPPRRDADFASFARAVAARYGRSGSFWAEHPALAPEPILTYEIWNEQNSRGFWPQDGPAAPRRYASLFRASLDTITTVDRDATVVVGGLARADTTVDGIQFASQSFVAEMLASEPGLRSRQFGIGLHPYNTDGEDPVATPLNVVREFRHFLDSPEIGLSHATIHVTELGYVKQTLQGTQPASMPEYDEQTRATALRTVADQLTRSNCGVTQFLVHDWVSAEMSTSDPARLDDKERWWGIYNHDGTPKPPGTAFVDLVRQRASLVDRAVFPLC
jgi:hypothetical protein